MQHIEAPSSSWCSSSAGKTVGIKKEELLYKHSCNKKVVHKTFN